MGEGWGLEEENTNSGGLGAGQVGQGTHCQGHCKGFSESGQEGRTSATASSLFLNSSHRGETGEPGEPRLKTRKSQEPALAFTQNWLLPEPRGSRKWGSFLFRDAGFQEETWEWTGTSSEGF